ncbi:unnamed protein product [Clonostachys rhizophaga]|uniref:Uncharacterized protein n=1 Tax=Clonostachys rhizophaga TaxID=160324 RepID=A0A9N9VNK5_9HYPO|nr:unnamed protein product [Clonostachys rhizophaga]
MADEVKSGGSRHDTDNEKTSGARSTSNIGAYPNEEQMARACFGTNEALPLIFLVALQSTRLFLALPIVGTIYA